MKKISLIIIVIGAGLVARSQEFSPQVIANTGADIVYANGSLSYTVGEMTMVQTLSNNQNILTQGFQQPGGKTATGVNDVTPEEAGSLTVYPNPAIGNVWIGFKLAEVADVNIDLYNGLGQDMGSIYSSGYAGVSVIQQTDISALSAGIYFVTMSFVSSQDNQIHIITRKFQVLN